MLSLPARPSRPAAVQDASLSSDPRWELVERILSTTPFQKSANLRALLFYLAEHSIQNGTDDLSERRIGIAVFGKAADYSPVEDSAVRVHVRQLRLRLHEFFAQDGRNETLRMRIPKGSYALEFYDAIPEAGARLSPLLVTRAESASGFRLRVREPLFWTAIAAAIICGCGWYRTARAVVHPRVAWPLNAVIQPNRQTRIVVSDSSLMLRLLSKHETTLDDYLQPDYREKLIPRNLPPGLDRLIQYVSESQLSSFADLTATAGLIKLAGPLNGELVLTSARDLDRRDLEHGDYVFVGSPTSNPWVSLFSDKLNFQEVEDTVGGRIYFLNRNPLPGEAKQYQGLSSTGSTGDDYATISVLPGPIGQGNVMILQGLRQDGTEALSALLVDPGDRDLLQEAVKRAQKSTSPYFEALVRSQAVAGAPVSVNIVAVRSIQP